MKLKLCYIWVSEYRNFKNTGFNFSSTEKFNYDHGSGSLTKERIKELPENFFGKGIVDVSGLIGKNGSGKSNALELVCKLMKGGKTSVTEDFLIVMQENERFVCYRSKDAPWMLSYDFPLQLKKYERNIDPLKVVYFSNVFDERVHNFDNDVSDISYNKRFNRYRFLQRKKTDFEKQIEFIDSYLFDLLNIETPTKIRVTSKVFNNRYNSSAKERMYGGYYKELEEFSKMYKSRLKEIKSNNKFYFLLVYSFFEETLRNLSNYRNLDDTKDYYLNEFIQFTGLYKNERTETMVEDIVKWMRYIAERIITTYKDRKDTKEIILFNKQLDMLLKIKDSIKEIDFEYKAEGLRHRNTEYFLFDYNSKANEIIFKYLGLFEQSRMFEINWLGISSGHKAYLNIFSLLHHELKRVKRDNLLLCIDEGDLYLHPQWQIEFFDKLINIIPKIFTGNIQLILTSHSPFLLSDLPKQNLTIVAPNESTSAVNGNNLKTETFAGNIYALYAEPFFLGNQRISLFAKKKIDALIKKLEALKKDPKSFSRIDLEREIDLIGDKVIKFHLLKKLNND